MERNDDVRGPSGSLNRRAFLGAAAAMTLSAGTLFGGKAASSVEPAGKKFKLKYGPSLGLFREHAGRDPVDNLKFIADQGFRAFFDNGLMGRAPSVQDAIAREADRLGLEMGPFVAYADFKTKSLVTQELEIRTMLSQRLRDSVELSKRTNARWALVVPGRYDESLEWDYQTANVVDNLKRLAEICEPAGLIMVIEPLNPWDHPGLFLTGMPQAFQICRAVASPSCKIVDDMYHQQITEGNLIPNIDRAWSEIASFHIGDSPGRKEPTTGEINYRNIFKHINAKGYEGVLCMEHGKSLDGKEGETALIEAYRACDSF